MCSSRYKGGAGSPGREGNGCASPEEREPKLRIFDRFKKVKETAETHGDKIADGVDKATDMIDEKTGGKFGDQLDKVDDMADQLRDEDEAEA